MSHTEAAMNTGTCEPPYRGFDRMLQHQQQIFVFTNLYFCIDWSVAFYREFNLAKLIK